MTLQQTARQIAEQTAQRCAEVLWARDAASHGLGMEILEALPGRASVQMTVRDDMVNGHGTGHGGMTFALADSAFAVACNSYNRPTVAAACEIRFLAPTRLGDVLVATAVERSREGRDGVYDVTVRSEDRTVAEFLGHSRELRGALLEDDSE